MTYFIDVDQLSIIKSDIFDRAFNSGYSLNKLRFKNAIEWLFDPVNKTTIVSHSEFDYPSYCGLPNKISNKLSGDEVDLIQEVFHDLTNYINNQPAFGFKNPQKNAAKITKHELIDFDPSKIKCKTTKFMLKHYWNQNNVYEIKKQNTKTIKP